MKDKFQITKETKKIGTLASGLELEIHFTTLTQGKEGPNVYIQSGIHGGEVTYWIVKEAYDFLKKNKLNGSVTFVSLANPVAWTQRTYFSTNGKFDFYMGRDWNGNYPGKVDGSLGERIANVLFEKASKSDLVIDLHTSRDSIPFNIVMSQKDLELAKATRLEFTQLLDINSVDKAKEYKKTLNGALCEINVSNICIECGSHDSFEPLYVENVYKSVLGILGFKKVIEFQNKKVKQSIFEKLETYNSPDGGFIKFNKKAGDKVKSGEIIATLLHPTNLETSTEIKAKNDGVILKLSPTHIYNPGDEVLQVIVAK